MFLTAQEHHHAELWLIPETQRGIL